MACTWQLTLLAVLFCPPSDERLVYRTEQTLSRSARQTKPKPSYMETTTDMIESTGDIAETHEVVTEDGYIVCAHRMVPPTVFDADKVILLLHGIGGSSDNWFIYRNDSLPRVLSEAGYDVWMASFRGSMYSNSHVKYKAAENDNRYWQFSFHEEGLYDLPAFIDLVLNETGTRQLYLLGHSQGNTACFVLLSMRPEYNDKVKLLLTYSPVAYVKHNRSPLLRPFIKDLSYKAAQKLTRSGNLYWMGSHASTLRLLRELSCGALPLTQVACLHVMNMFMGNDYMYNAVAYRALSTHFPDGVAIQELIHFLQISQTDNFAPYDFGSRRNMAKYNATKPPRYPLSKIRTPIVVFYSDNDYIVSKKDRARILQELPSVAAVHRVPYDKFSHLNFVIGDRSRQLLFQPTVKILQAFGNAPEDTRNKLNK